MFNAERWQEIFEAVAKNKLRTFLTGVSVASGIFILVILLGVGKGLQNGIAKQFENDASGLISFWSGTTTKEFKGLNPGRQIQFRNSDYNATVQKFDQDLEIKSANYIFWSGTMSHGNETGNYRFVGVNTDYLAVENASIVEGRFINHNDIINSEKVAVIGMKLKQDMFKDMDPIGEQLVINDINFKVVGVFTDPAGEREETRAYIPITTTQQAYGIGDNISNLDFTLKKWILTRRPWKSQ